MFTDWKEKNNFKKQRCTFITQNVLSVNSQKHSSIDQYCPIELSVLMKCFKSELSNTDLLATCDYYALKVW